MTLQSLVKVVVVVVIVTVVDIGIYITTLCLSISLYVYLDPTLTQVLHHKDVACTSALMASSPTSSIKASEVLQPAVGRHKLQYNILDSVFLKNREEKDAYGVAPHRVKSLIEVSQ